MNYKFITPVSMAGTKEQIEAILPNLTSLGYSVDVEYLKGGMTLCTNWNSTPENVDVGQSGVFDTKKSRTFIETWNSDLFLALSAMTDKEDGIKGEWWVYRGFSDESFTSGKIYEQITSNIDDLLALRCNQNTVYNNSSGWMGDNKNRFCKATKQEILNYFNNLISKAPKEMKEKTIIGYKAPCDVNNVVKKDSIYVALTSNMYVVKDKKGKGIPYILSAQIVETWSPVYEEEFKEGDYVVTSSRCDGWGSGSELYNKVVKFVKTEQSPSGPYSEGSTHVVYLDFNGREVRTGNLQIRKATEEEIAQFKAKQEVVITLGDKNIEVKIKGGKVTADNRDFPIKWLKSVENKMIPNILDGVLTHYVTYTSAKIGCSTFSKEEISKIIETAEKQLPS